MFSTDKNRRLQNYQNAHELFFFRKCTTWCASFNIHLVI